MNKETKSKTIKIEILDRFQMSKDEFIEGIEDYTSHSSIDFTDEELENIFEELVKCPPDSDDIVEDWDTFRNRIRKNFFECYMVEDLLRNFREEFE